MLLPPDIRTWLPEDHLSYFVSDVVDELDLSEITAPYEREEHDRSDVALLPSLRSRKRFGAEGPWTAAAWRGAPEASAAVAGFGRSGLGGGRVTGEFQRA